MPVSATHLDVSMEFESSNDVETVGVNERRKLSKVVSLFSGELKGQIYGSQTVWSVHEYEEKEKESGRKSEKLGSLSDVDGGEVLVVSMVKRSNCSDIWASVLRRPLSPTELSLSQ